MHARAMEGTCLAALVKMAKPLCRQAQRHCPRTGPGRPPDYDLWQMAVLIMIAILTKRKSKSAQYRFLHEHRRLLQRLLGLAGFPARSTYFQRYHQAHRLFKLAIELQADKAMAEGVADVTLVAADKSLIAARGPQWHHKDRRNNRMPQRLRGVDRDSDWGYSPYHGWVQGYSYEVLVTATRGATTVFALLASAGRASVSEHLSFADKIDHLPRRTRYVLADTGYDNMSFGDQIEYNDQNRRTGRRFLCPANPRRSGARTADEAETQLPPNATLSQRRRVKRLRYLEGKTGRRLYARRAQTVEPFNDWFKNLFDLTDHAWHRGLPNNQTMLLGAIFSYQLLLRYNHRRGHHNGQVQWILDTL